MSIFLLIIICIPLVFTILMWFQLMFTNVPIDQLSINPLRWFGYEGTFWLTLFLGLISFSVGYVYIIKIKPGVTTLVEEEPAAEIREPVEERVEEIAAEDIEEVMAAEDQEDVEEFDSEDFEESSEDIEDYDIEDDE